MYIALAVLAAIIIYIIAFYNKLKTLQVRIQASIQEIGNQLKRQADLIPNLVETAKGFLKHEKDIFTLLTDARKAVESAVKSGKGSSIDKAQEILGKALSSFQILVESNPQLQSAPVVQNLMDELRDTADKLMYSRRTMIDLTADFNTAISTIPGVWFASLLGFKAEKGLSTPVDGEFLSVSQEETKSPKVNLE